MREFTELYILDAQKLQGRESGREASRPVDLPEQNATHSFHRHSFHLPLARELRLELWKLSDV